MSDIATYDANVDGAMVLCDEGEFVTIQDYRYMERKYLECKAELAEMKAQRDALLEAMHNIRRHLKIVSGGMHDMSGAWQIANKAIEQAQALEGK